MPKTGKNRISGQKNTWPCIFMPGVSLRHKYSAVPWRMSRQNAEFSGGVGNFVERAQNKPKIYDRMTGQTCTKTGSRRKTGQTCTQKRTTLQPFQKVSGRVSGGAGEGTALRNAGKRRREHFPAKQKSLQTHAARLQALEAAVTPAPHPDPEFYRTGQRR